MTKYLVVLGILVGLNLHAMEASEPLVLECLARSRSLEISRNGSGIYRITLQSHDKSSLFPSSEAKISRMVWRLSGCARTRDGLLCHERNCHWLQFFDDKGKEATLPESLPMGPIEFLAVPRTRTVKRSPREYLNYRLSFLGSDNDNTTISHGFETFPGRHCTFNEP